MTLTAAKVGGWNTGDVLTSDEMDHLQAELLKALDGVNGGSYTLGSHLTLGGAGELRISGTQRVLSGGSLIFDAGSTFGSGASLALTGGADLTLNSGSDLHLLSGATGTFDAGSILDVFGDLDIESGGDLTLRSGGELDALSGSVVNLRAGSFTNLFGALDVESGGAINVKSGGEIYIENGGLLIVEDLDELAVNAENTQIRLSMVPFNITDLASAGDEDWSAGSTFGWLQTATPAGNAISFHLPLRVGDELTTLTVLIEGGTGAGHGGSLPAVMPQLRIVQVATDGTETLLDSETDASATAAAYDAFHSFTWVGSITPTDQDPIYVQVRGESGANSVANTTRLQAISGSVVANVIRSNLEVY